MSKLQQLKLFVSERLTAAAEEILGAVERTILEYHHDLCLSKADKESALLTLAAGLKQEEEEVFTAVSQEVSRPEAEASTQSSHTEFCPVLVKQETSGFPEPQEHWPSQGEGKLQELIVGDAATSLDSEQITELSSCCTSQTVASGEGDLLPGTSTEWIKTEAEAESCGGSDFLQPFASESVDDDDTTYNTASLCPATSAGSWIEPLETQTEDKLCYICGKIFSRRSHLKRHMLIHTGQKPHCCKECGKRFARVECLRIHLRIHTVERPYACNVCGKGFKQRSNMVYHVRTHTGEKPHRCDICSRPFAHKKDVVRHMHVHTKKTEIPV